MRHIGFTGTRYGMTDLQKMWASLIMGAFWQHAAIETRSIAVTAHHGDCIGADAEFHELVKKRTWWRVVSHPPIDTKRQAFCTCDESRPPGDYLKRNADIVAESDAMIAAPAEAGEQQRGGTWATIRMARRAGKPLAIVWPDGRVTYERWPQ